jgi:hypothetical protein
VKFALNAGPGILRSQVQGPAVLAKAQNPCGREEAVMESARGFYTPGFYLPVVGISNSPAVRFPDRWGRQGDRSAKGVRRGASRFRLAPGCPYNVESIAYSDPLGRLKTLHATRYTIVLL